MAVKTYNMDDNADDFTWNVNTNMQEGVSATTVNAQRNNLIPSPGIIKSAEFHINTSAIPESDTVVKAIFKFYGSAYLATKGYARSFNVSIYTGSGWLPAGAGTFTAAGTYSVTLDSDDLQYINKSGDTRIRVTVPDPGASAFRSMLIRTREHTFGIFQAELTVHHRPTKVYGVVIG